eukprot:CAMPEP_0116840842 /NCGR_PEP_ID=MMETSP0418-20121206/10590_1 /TAXON_ID=1158023 /ORGANISM="Astrosyne radiata, Strain 13vi08-1A" /LENGTH=43 /DNA_ID= /DNA_START= /DNA_END= /DNA_ORIENTATION=
MTARTATPPPIPMAARTDNDSLLPLTNLGLSSVLEFGGGGIVQ